MDYMDYKKIGKFIVELRKENKMTQEKLAEKLFVDRTTISKWELGENNINTEVLIKMSKIFGITLNEMILGEKLNKDNVDVISNVTANAIKKNVRFKKYLNISILVIIILSFLFLLYYLLSSYNSIQVYDVNGGNDKFLVDNSLLIISRDKAYINIGYIDNLENVDVKSTRLYFERDNKEITLYENDELEGYYVTTYEDSDFRYNDLKYLLSNLNLEIKFDDNAINILKLNLSKSYSNNKFFHKKGDLINQENINNADKQIPKYIKRNFKYNSKEDYYYYYEIKNNSKVKHMYYPSSSVYMVEEKDDDYIENFIYSYPDDITYNKSNLDGNIVTEFVYSNTNKECITDSCDYEVLKYFEDKYLSRILFD